MATAIEVAATVEKALMLAAAEHDAHKVEETGNNAGPRVEMYLESTGLGKGNPWCAAFVYWCTITAINMVGKVKGTRLSLKYMLTPPSGMARVKNWHTWATQHHLLVKIPKRGDLGGWLNSDGNGHLFFIAEYRKVVGISWVRTIEGNGNEEGSREGTKVVRKWRVITRRYWFIGR